MVALNGPDGGHRVFEQLMDTLGLEPRPQQTKLIKLAREAVNDRTQKFVQAGTGVGKSFALLSAALEAARVSGEPSVVVCPTNALVRQYCDQDAPRVQKAVGGKFAYIKGRSNYLCSNSRALQELGKSQAVNQYLELTRKGKLEWADLNLDWTYACPGNDDCKADQQHTCGAGEVCQCPYLCGAFQARSLAADAHVVVTNAHVLVWDYLVQQFSGGNAQLLPTYGAVFIDECHELEGVGRDCTSDEIKPGSPVYDALPGLRPWVDAATLRMVQADQQEALLNRDDELVKMAEEAANEAQHLENLAEAEGQDPDMAKHYRKEAKTLQRFADFVAEDEDAISVIRVDSFTNAEDPKTLLIRRTVDASYMFNQILGHRPSVLVSGTIPGSDPRRLGLARCTIENVGHPFDYSKSTLVISPHSAKDRGKTYSRAQQVAQAINSTGGGTLVLFTSWRDVEQVVPMIVRELRPELRGRVYVQSKEDPTTLRQDIEDFKADGNAVLIGVRTLFTGLDIPGPALRQLVIWKLPYGVPTLEVKAIEQKFGRAPYLDAMLCVLVQGIGRLVRRVEDQGRVFIVDSRAKNLRWRQNTMSAHVAEFGAHVPPKR